MLLLSNQNNLHRLVFYWSLVLLVVSLPLSQFFMSVATIILVLNWILEGRIKEKMNKVMKRESLVVFLAFYFLFVLGLLHTSDFGYAFKDLKIKLPLLALPLVMGTSEPLSKGKGKGVLLFFVASVITGTLISTCILYGFFSIEVGDTRKISLFISHIRFSLLINMAIFILLHFYINEHRTIKRIEKIGFPVIILWLTIFLVLLKALTGIVIFFITGMVSAYIWIRRINHPILKMFLVVLWITLPLLGLSYITKSITRYYSLDQVDFMNLEPRTPGGNDYIHYLNNKEVENGHYIWIYVCEEELRTEWNKRSSIGFDSLDRKGQELKHTLIRYMTSLDFRKDAIGVTNLSDQDIKQVEAGLTNYLFGKKLSLYPKIYEIIWQIDMYRKGGNPSGSSIAQRIEYLKTGIRIIKENFWSGVGTGDVDNTFKEHYKLDHSQLLEPFRRRMHNQYLTFFITLGVFGFLLCLFTFFYPVIKERGYKDFLFLVFFIIATLSMVNEDTLENHAGVTFVATFYALLLFGRGYRLKTD